MPCWHSIVYIMDRRHGGGTRLGWSRMWAGVWVPEYPRIKSKLVGGIEINFKQVGLRVGMRDFFLYKVWGLKYGFYGRLVPLVEV